MERENPANKPISENIIEENQYVQLAKNTVNRVLNHWENRDTPLFNAIRSPLYLYAYSYHKANPQIKSYNNTDLDEIVYGYAQFLNNEEGKARACPILPTIGLEVEVDKRLLVDDKQWEEKKFSQKLLPARIRYESLKEFITIEPDAGRMEIKTDPANSILMPESAVRDLQISGAIDIDYNELPTAHIHVGLRGARLKTELYKGSQGRKRLSSLIGVSDLLTGGYVPVQRAVSRKSYEEGAVWVKQEGINIKPYLNEERMVTAQFRTFCVSSFKSIGNLLTHTQALVPLAIPDLIVKPFVDEKTYKRFLDASDGMQKAIKAIRKKYDLTEDLPETDRVHMGQIIFINDIKQQLRFTQTTESLAELEKLIAEDKILTKDMKNELTRLLYTPNEWPKNNLIKDAQVIADQYTYIAQDLMNYSPPNLLDYY